MRTIVIADECTDFIDSQNEHVKHKFFQLIHVLENLKVVKTHYVKKLQSTDFYELRITSINEYRVIIFAINHSSFVECTEAVCLYGFQKKSTKDYKKALNRAKKILERYLDRN